MKVTDLFLPNIKIMKESRKEKCPICKKQFFARGIKSHIWLAHNIRENITHKGESPKILIPKRSLRFSEMLQISMKEQIENTIDRIHKGDSVIITKEQAVGKITTPFLRINVGYNLIEVNRPFMDEIVNKKFAFVFKKNAPIKMIQNQDGYKFNPCSRRSKGGQLGSKLIAELASAIYPYKNSDLLYEVKKQSNGYALYPTK